MLHDDVILDLVEELDIEIDEIPTKFSTQDFIIDPFVEGSVIVDVDRDFVVILDLESMGLGDPDTSGTTGKIHRIIFFTKSILGKKSTFGRSSLNINANIQTNGTAYINSANHNIVARQFVFGKTVSAKKLTFARVSFGIIDNIQTAGTNTIGDVNLYGTDFYGVGVYGDIIGYGSGVYGFDVYRGEAVSFSIRFGSVISGDALIKQTSIAEVSLAPHGAPAANTNHAIRFRARTTSGSTGTIKAVLREEINVDAIGYGSVGWGSGNYGSGLSYEETVDRSGVLTSIPLTNVLTDYFLYIPSEEVASISDYSNLSIRFWGYDPAGNPLVFQVSRIYLELPIVTGVTQYGAISRPITFTKAVSGVVSSKQTPVAEISLASHGIPSERTNHFIKLRARTVSGSTGILRASLYEGTVNRSGHLGTTPLTNTLEDYTLVIADFLAAAIIDYTNLSIKFWGYDIAGNPLVFQVSRIYLELPTSSGNVTLYGSISRPITFTKAVSGIINSKRTTTAEISLASHGTPSERTNHSIKVRARTTSHLTGILKAELYEGSTLRSGTVPLATSALTNSFADYSLTIPDAAAATIISYSNLSIKFWGFDPAGNALLFEVSRIYLELPASVANTTHYGVISRPITFTKAVSGIATRFAVISRPTTFIKAVSGFATHFAAISRAITFTKAVSGTVGVTRYGVISRPITFTKAVSGTVSSGGTGYGSPGWGSGNYGG
jgi:hypothetical protein